MYENAIIPLLIAPLAYAVILPIALVVYIINSIGRTVVSLIAWWSEQGLVTLVSEGRDAVWAYAVEGKTPMCLVATVTDQNSLDMGRTAYLFEKHVLLHEDTRRSTGIPGFTSTMEETYRPYQKFEKIFTSFCGYSAWKLDEKFNITKHFREVSDKQRYYTQQDVMELLSDLSTPMDESKPQWELIRIPRFQDTNGVERSVLIFRFHHVYLDGLSILLMLLRTNICENAKLSLDPTTFKIELWKKIIHYINSILYAPYHFYTMLTNRTGKRTFWIGPAKCLTPGKKFYGSTPPISMDIFKSIRAKTDATIPNVVALAFANAVRKTIPSHRVVPQLRWGEITAMLPYENADPQNGFTLFSYDVDTTQDADTAHTFNQVVSDLKRNRLGGLAGPEPLLVYYVFAYIGKLPQVLLPYILNGVYNSAFLSNVPCFKEKITIFESPVHEFNPWPPIINDTGIILASVSYNNMVSITSVADSSWLTYDELNKISLEMTNTIYNIEAHGFIPNTQIDALLKASPDFLTFDATATCEKISDEDQDSDSNSVLSANSDHADDHVEHPVTTNNNIEKPETNLLTQRKIPVHLVTENR